MQFLKSLISSGKQAKREFEEMERFFSPDNESARQIVFYAERSADYRYYKDFIDEILNQSDLSISYLTSASNDPVFSSSNKRIVPFFIQNMLPSVMAKLDAQVIVMTTPDLNMGIVKRAPAPVHHAYVFHGVSSVHQQYRNHAFDHYDSILCIGDYHVEELRKIESIYNLKPRELPVVGYPYIERIRLDHQQRPSASADKRLKCLIAPTWDPNKRSSILDCCIEPLIETIGKIDMDFVIRPHPEYLKRFAKQTEAIKKLLQSKPQIVFEEAPGDPKASLHDSDILITDHSTICFDFFLGTERPVVFIDTPTRCDNEEMGKLGIEPIENRYRANLGAQVGMQNLSELKTLLPKLVQDSKNAEFKSRVEKVQKELMANWGKSAELGAAHILSHCKN